MIATSSAAPAFGAVIANAASSRHISDSLKPMFHAQGPPALVSGAFSRRNAFGQGSNQLGIRQKSIASAAASNDAAAIELATTAEANVESSGDIQDAAAFLSDVASLVKLVDSRDIVELEIKHKNYEVLIRKNTAPPPPPPQPLPALNMGAHVMAHSAPVADPFPPPAPVAPSPPPAPAPAAASKPAAAPKPGGVPLLSPMAGTFYRCPGPGEPPFSKVGDRVNKGQVVCIVEAMKLMNEIEADQSGTIVEILVEDGKPVSIETPLFLIKP